MSEPWFPTHLLSLCLSIIGGGVILGFIFAKVHTIFFGGD